MALALSPPQQYESAALWGRNLSIYECLKGSAIETLKNPEHSLVGWLSHFHLRNNTNPPRCGDASRQHTNAERKPPPVNAKVSLPGPVGPEPVPTVQRSRMPPPPN